MLDFPTASECLFLSSDGLVSSDIHRDASLSHGIGVELSWLYLVKPVT